MNPHALIRALAPQASASANSATRTSAEGTLATGDPDPHIGKRLPRRSWCQDGCHGRATASTDPATTAYEPSYEPGGEVVDLCRDLIRIDTTNYGDDSGPGERKAAEHVATLLDEVGIESELFELESGRTSLVAQWGGTPGGEGALLLHGHLDVVPAAAEDWQVDPFSGEIQDGYVWGRGAVDMKDFDAMLLSVVRARTRAGAVPERPVVLCFTADEEAGGHHGAQVLVEHHREHLAHCTEAVGEVGGFSTTIRGQRLYLVEAAEKGMAWMKLTARGRAGHGSMINDDNAVTRLTAAVAADRRARVAGAADADDADAAGRRRRDRGHRGDPENAETLVEEFGEAARMMGAVIRNTANPTMLQRRLQGERDPDRGHRPRRRAFPAGLRGRVLRHHRRALRRRASSGPSSPTSSPGRRRTTVTSSTR